uniref:Uncharacterized protein n=1 Tax=Meloidogyne floridensis TaxID=298350 RepID=A0A915NH55_9BILA
MFSFTELFLIYLIIPKIVNGIHVEISGTVYCKFHLGDTSVKARLQGAKVELLERETLFKEGVFAEGLTDENGIFKIEGDPTDGNLLATGHHYATDISLLPGQEGKYELEISVGVAVAADVTFEGKKVQIENDEKHLKTTIDMIKK